jgi:predicted ArsR family transcriptional regulator
MRGFTRNVAAIGVLAEPVRRELYLFVCSQTEPVTRDQAAKAMGIAHHQAKFHLDRLEAEGLLATDYVRLTGRSGPGAGRPSKRYRRGGTEIAITLPERQYEVAGRLLAEAITASARTGTPVTDTLRMAAGAHGAAIAAAATDRPTSVRAALDLAVNLLTAQAYEPRQTGPTVVLINCPFQALARSHTKLICGMNHSILAGFVQAAAPNVLAARLDPEDNRCCVILTALGGAD